MNERPVFALLIRSLLVATILSIAVVLLVPSSPVPWLIARMVALALIPPACVAGPLLRFRNQHAQRTKAMTTSYTLARMEVLPSTYADIKQRLESAGYNHAIREGDLDMTGIALQRPVDPRDLSSAEASACLDSDDPAQRDVLRVHLDALRDDLRPPIIDAEAHATMKSYRHYKGGTYTLLMVTRNSEARDELFAVYVSHQTQQVWTRPWLMFTEVVRWADGVHRPRFTEWNP